MGEGPATVPGIHARPISVAVAASAGRVFSGVSLIDMAMSSGVHESCKLGGDVDKLQWHIFNYQ